MRADDRHDAGLLKATWEAPDGREAFALLIRYAMLVSKQMTIQTLENTLVPILGEGVNEGVMPQVQRMIEEAAKRRFAEGRAEGRVEGEAKGRAKALLAVFSARGIAVSDELHARILSCTEMATLDRWIVKAVTAESASDVIPEA